MSHQNEAQDFIQQANQAQAGLLRESIAWLRYNKKWWLTPIMFGLLLVALFVILSSTVIAPFIYTLF